MFRSQCVYFCIGSALVQNQLVQYQLVSDAGISQKYSETSWEVERQEAGFILIIFWHPLKTVLQHDSGVFQY